MPDRAARRVLLAWMARLHPVFEAAQRASWEAACHATPENRTRAEDAARIRDRALHDRVGHTKVDESLDEGVDDPLLARALARLRRLLASYREPRPERLIELEAGLEERFALYRAEVGGRRLAAHEVTRTLQEETASTVLEATWRAAIGIGQEVAEQVREAVRLRNAQAAEIGFPDYRSLRLHADEVELDDLAAFLDELEAGTAEPWRTEKRRIDRGLADRFDCNPGDLRSWHYGDVFLQGPPAAEDEGPDPYASVDVTELTRRTFEGIGLDVASVLESSDLLPREAKNPHAFCTHLDRRGDVRVLANVVPSRRWMRTMLHEFGHAAYDLHLDVGLPWILVRPAHAGATEGIAMLFERLVDDPAWQARVARVPVDEGAAEATRRRFLTFARWALVMSRFEERLYTEPDADLDAIWWDLVERLQGIPRPDPLPPAAWAAKIHVACYPVYYHSYLFGAAIAARLERLLRAMHPDGGLVDNETAGRFLADEVFAPSATVPWPTLLEGAMGAPFGAAWLLDDLVAPAAAE